jgi:hypothetical protein
VLVPAVLVVLQKAVLLQVFTRLSFYAAVMSLFICNLMLFYTMRCRLVVSSSDCLWYVNAALALDQCCRSGIVYSESGTFQVIPDPDQILRRQVKNLCVHKRAAA